MIGGWHRENLLWGGAICKYGIPKARVFLVSWGREESHGGWHVGTRTAGWETRSGGRWAWITGFLNGNCFSSVV